MVDFRKKLGSKEIIKKTNPLEIYDFLDRRSIAGPLRPAQEHIVKEWFENRKEQKDLIIKLHTGEGKTLIGLLILQSKINSGDGPCLYVCPNIYLAEQTCVEAKKFGIPFCIIDQADNHLPNEYLDGHKILITYVQKVFNGKSIFGLDNASTNVNTIILDDSHACIDTLKQTFTIQIKKEGELYNRLKELFSESIREQGEGSYLEIESGERDTLLPIPYWSWVEKISEVVNLILQHKDDNEIKFVWPLIKDHLKQCQAFITGKLIEISPYNLLIQKFGCFHNANQRILMSATTQDDSFFIKGLGFGLEAIIKPLINPIQKWSGEKMILIPSLFDDSLDRDKIVNLFAKPSKKTFGICALVPSFHRAEQYEALGALRAKSETIFKLVNNLKSRIFEKTVLFANRYDGIDLPDEACRILIMDSKPVTNSLVESYEEICRATSDVVNIKIAQKVEQGLGRSVRGEKDYSVILLIGPDLVRFIKSSQTNKYFSVQTKKQIEIGLEIAKLANDDIDEDKSPEKVLLNLIGQSLRRDEGWKEFYIEEMNQIDFDTPKPTIHDRLVLEKQAEDAHFKGNSEKAASVIQRVIDLTECELEKGWYLQTMARYMYFIAKTESNKLQKTAFEKNLQLLKPKDGISYKKLEFINENRLKRIKNWLTAFSSYEELILKVDEVFNDLSFGMPAEKFEMALKEVGIMLGFLSQRPDKEYKKGPDNLWCGVNNHYFLFECKSDVKDDREEISKYEAGQMNNHLEWFKKEYGILEVFPILIIPTKKLSYHADLPNKVKIIRKGKLKLLKLNIKSFLKELSAYNLEEMGDSKLNEFLITNNLNIPGLFTDYTEDFYHKGR